ncbi:MAG: penicillin acylase family protein [Candidatus Acidiferrales bacterium]
MRTVGRLFYWLFTLFVLAAASLIWWYIFRPLPQVDGAATLPGLQKEATVDRDSWGVPHIHAASLNDLAEAQGYVMAQDRLWQMDLLRRIARGRLAEIVGPAALPLDRQFRTFGFGRAADRDVSLLDSEARSVYESYARGVNRFIDEHQNRLPLEFSLLKYKPEPWQPSDSAVIAGYMYETLTDTWEEELNRAKVTERVGVERAKDLFSEDAPMDHFVVGDPNVADDGSEHSRANTGDEEDDDDMPSDAVLKADLDAAPMMQTPEPFTGLASALWPSLQTWIEDSRTEIRHGLGSNNWVVSGAHTATGKPLLANDTHLELSVPPIWYEAHLTAPGWNVKGFTLPGAPLVIIGHNDRIAWGFTNNGADVQDLYIETFNPSSPDEYRVHGAWTRAEVFDEVLHIKGQPDEHMKLIVTRHGPIVHREGDKAYALRWTATEPGGLFFTYNWLGRAQNWAQFRNELKHVWGPSQNVVYADVDGNIGYIMAARVPIRKKGRGDVPVPGDIDDYEWTGYIPFDQLPQAFNPESGLIVTANARVVGPSYKPYLTDRWEEPYRTARIYDLLHDKRDLRPEDMLKVQTDTYSYPHLFLAEQLSSAVKTARPRDVRAQKLIERAKDWNGIAEADSPLVSFLEATRRTALVLLLEPYLGKDTSLYEWRSTSFLQKVLTDRPAKWLPPAYKTYDELLCAAADRAVGRLAERSKSERIEDWQWRRFDSLDMLHPIGRQGLLKRLLSISNQPQSGTMFSPRAATQHDGPAMRFVANPANWDDSILLIPAGQSGQFGSSHYTDQFSYWYNGKPIAAPFSDSAEAKARRHTLILKPAP